MVLFIDGASSRVLYKLFPECPFHLENRREAACFSVFYFTYALLATNKTMSISLIVLSFKL